MIDIASFIKYTNLVNSIFKNVYNSGDKFENIWHCKEGKFFMYHEDQFPSYVEIKLDYSDIKKTAKGQLSKKALLIKDYLDYINDNKINFEINSIKFYNFLKEEKTLIEDIEFSNKDMIIKKSNSTSTKFEFNKFPKEYDFDPNRLLREIDIKNNLVEQILDKGNDPFFLIWNFNNTKDDIVNCDDIKDCEEGFLRVKLNKKFIPYLCRKKKKDNYEYSKLSLQLYETDLEGIYDLVFINKYDIATVTSVSRILDIV